MNKHFIFILGFSALLALGCSNKSDKDGGGKLSLQDGSALRVLTASEREQDYNQMVQLFKTYYGPYQYKEKVLGVAFDKVVAQYRSEAINATTDEEFSGAIMKVGAALRDGHIQIVIPNSASRVQRYAIPLVLDSVEGKAIVLDVSKETSSYSGISVGDEILSVDGQSVSDIHSEVLKYRRTGTTAADRWFVFSIFSRPTYMTSLIPKRSMATVVVKHADGIHTQVEIPWEVRKYNAQIDKVASTGTLNMTVPFVNEYNTLVNSDSNITKEGAVEPFFWNEGVRKVFKWVRVYPSDTARAKYGLKTDEKPPIFAALYNFKKKNILLVRSATFDPDDYRPRIYMKAYQALMDEYEGVADVLVLDQTHNPGGSYCADFYELFGKPGDAQMVQQCRADRKWINDFTIDEANAQIKMERVLEARAAIAMGIEVEKAYDRGDFLTPPLPLFTGFKTVQDFNYKWTKPMLLLVDEYAGSCGDIFPMLVKFNKRAKVFGQQTMGLGGNVEPVGTLSNSQIIIKMTRGLFHPYRADGQYQAEDYVENNGVMPDYPYALTVNDVRSGFMGYVKAFSEKAIEQIPAN